MTHSFESLHSVCRHLWNWFRNERNRGNLGRWLQYGWDRDGKSHNRRSWRRHRACWCRRLNFHVHRRWRRRCKRSKTPPEKRQKLGKHEIEAGRRSSTAPPLSDSESPSDVLKEAPIMTDWEELGGLDDDGLYVMDEAPLLDDGV